LNDLFVTRFRSRHYYPKNHFGRSLVEHPRRRFRSDRHNCRVSTPTILFNLRFFVVNQNDWLLFGDVLDFDVRNLSRFLGRETEDVFQLRTAGRSVHYESGNLHFEQIVFSRARLAAKAKPAHYQHRDRGKGEFHDQVLTGFPPWAQSRSRPLSFVVHSGTAFAEEAIFCPPSSRLPSPCCYDVTSRRGNRTFDNCSKSGVLNLDCLKQSSV